MVAYGESIGKALATMLEYPTRRGLFGKKKNKKEEECRMPP
jgi:hypothetical protein